jgi:hypothetical protein
MKGADSRPLNAIIENARTRGRFSISRMHEARPRATNIFRCHSSVWKSRVDRQVGEGEGWFRYTK